MVMDYCNYPFKFVLSQSHHEQQNIAVVTYSRLSKYIAGLLNVKEVCCPDCSALLTVWDVSSAQPVGRGSVAAEARWDNSCAVQRQSSHTPLRTLLVCTQLFLSAWNAYCAQLSQHRATPDIIATEASLDRIPVRNFREGFACYQLI